VTVAAPTQILVADDEPQVLSMIKDVLEASGFAVRTAGDGSQALTEIRRLPPDIVILDLDMPQMDGFSVSRQLRADPLFEHLPLIILSARGTRENKIEGLNLGADDFISKPVDLPELLARIRMIIKRSRQGLDANPLTHLPGNVSIQNRIVAAMNEKKRFAVLYLDLNHFKAYNDVYGYDAGDRVIKTTSELLLRMTLDKSGGRDFVGHIGGDDFIVLVEPERMETVAQRIIEEFDMLVPIFYNAKDRRRKKIIAKDRLGKTQEYSLLSIAIGICHNQQKELTSYAQIAQLGAELKKHAKGKPGSAYVIDRRSR
jgi:diguanylate cyclase (GGDEF)-like protein